MRLTPKLDSFLSILRRFNECPGKVPLKAVVVGNQACDADSIVSAFVLAYYKNVKSGFLDSGSFIPFVRSVREDLKLKGETDVLFNEVGLENWDQLLPILPDKDSSIVQNVGWILTDHNSFPGAEVLEIYDHHLDEKKHDGARRKIAFDAETGQALTASTCSLLAREILEEPDLDPFREVLLLLYGVILVDSVNLDPAAGKATKMDFEVVHSLEEALGKSEAERKDLYQKCTSAKNSPSLWTRMSCQQALLFDYKDFEVERKERTFGISSIGCPIGTFLEKDGCFEEMRRMRERRSLNFLAVMSCFSPSLWGQDGIEGLDRSREILVLVSRSCSAGFFKELATSVESFGLEEKWVETHESEETVVKVFDQKNVKASRKQVAPLFFKMLDEFSFF